MIEKTTMDISLSKRRARKLDDRKGDHGY